MEWFHEKNHAQKIERLIKYQFRLFSNIRLVTINEIRLSCQSSGFVSQNFFKVLGSSSLGNLSMMGFSFSPYPQLYLRYLLMTVRQIKSSLKGSDKASGTMIKIVMTLCDVGPLKKWVITNNIFNHFSRASL